MITIREPVIEDAQKIEKEASNPNIGKTCNVPFPYPKGGGHSFIQRVTLGRQEKRQFAFVVECNNIFSGIVTLNDVDYSKQKAALDYWIAFSQWNKGIGTEAARLAISYAKESLNLDHLFSACLCGNPGSGAVLIKNGFKEIGRFTFKEGKFCGKEAIRFCKFL